MNTWTRRRRHTLASTILMLPILALASCVRDADEPPALRTVEREPVHVDTILPIEEELRRFRDSLDGEPPESLGGEWTTREALVRHFVDRLEGADTAAIAAMLVTRAEFAYLYYPHTVFVAPPYELSPGLVWYQMQNRSSRGLTRLMREFAGHELGYRSHSCDPAPEAQGAARIWTNCVVTFHPPGANEMSGQLFGNILELDGRFKFLTFANRF